MGSCARITSASALPAGGSLLTARCEGLVGAQQRSDHYSINWVGIHLNARYSRCSVRLSALAEAGARACHAPWHSAL